MKAKSEESGQKNEKYSTSDIRLNAENFRGTKIDTKEYERKRFTVAKMMAANEFNDSRSVEWLDLASGIHDISLTRTILNDLKANPMELQFDSFDGWQLKGTKHHYIVHEHLKNHDERITIGKAECEEDIHVFYEEYKKSNDTKKISVERIGDWRLNDEDLKDLPVTDILTEQERNQDSEMIKTLEEDGYSLTDNPYEAVFIFKNGKMLDGEFDSVHQVRGVDHRVIEMCIKDTDRYDRHFWSKVHSQLGVVLLVPESRQILVMEGQEFSEMQKSIIESLKSYSTKVYCKQLSIDNRNMSVQNSLKLQHDDYIEK